MTRHSEHQSDYFRGLESLRKVIQSLEGEIDRTKYEHYDNPEGEEEVYEKTLKDWNTKLLYCNSKLRKHNVTLDVVDSELKIVALNNQVRELVEKGHQFDEEVIGFLGDFWERMKSVAEKLRSLLSKVKLNVWKRLQASCVSYQGGQTQLSITRDYSKAVSTYTKNIEDVMDNVDQLLRSFDNGLKQDLFTHNTIGHHLLINCDLKAFPVLRLVPDVCEKLLRVCAVSRQWVDKDEQYVNDINRHLRDTRSRTRKKAQHLKSQQQVHMQYNQSLTQAYKQFTENKTRLSKIENELKDLEREIVQNTESKKYKAEEKKQKEGIVGFLEISITQTKKNYNLQMKRSRLLRQLQDIEENLKKLEVEIKSMERVLTAKTKEKKECEEKMEKSSAAYDTLQKDFDQVNQTLQHLEKEVVELTDFVTQLEIIQTVKTSPEKVDDLLERPPTVKLAPSLKQKIMARKRKLHSRLRQY